MDIEQARGTLRREYGVETAEEYRAAIEAARMRIRDARSDIAVLDRCAQTVWSRAEWQTPAGERDDSSSDRSHPPGGSMSENERIRTAFHEAGHAVVAYHFNHYGGRLTIVPANGIMGSAQTEAEWCDGSTDEEQICVLFAGLVAERRCDPTADPDGSRQDEEAAHRLLDLRPAGTEERLRAETERLVEQDWPGIEAVSTALLEAGTLEAEEWQMIVDATDEGLDWRDRLALHREVLRTMREERFKRNRLRWERSP